MIVLDTNVLSETLRAAPSPAVLGWLSGASAPLAITAITVGELLAGVRRLPAGRRRHQLAEAIEEILVGQGVVLAYDSDAARVYAEFHGRA